ncbi:Surfeit locus 1 family protein [Brevundimonas sp. AAP58]|uniref:SURF1 family protein n=1 Tax=Brevundimonas sp. AAP58 TaxID=1523422 RepID=UPI0006B9EC1C|nr:SURF1 family protein [Brevundimonas sp. AAP58]KPF73767.1 Surfeit locus 1 family protein [Brevundimonas sp. AAP58]
MAEAGARPGFPWLLTVLLIPALGLLIGLGVWQSQRLAWKTDLIARAEAAAAQPPALLADVLASPDPEFRRALVLCRGLPTAPFVELRSIQDGAPGFRLISACMPEGLGQTFLVDRGFVPESVSDRPRVAPSTLPLSLTVELRRTPPPGAMTPAPEGTRFYGRDNAAMARALGATTPPSEFTLFALVSPNPEWEALVASAPPAAFSNNHLGYALTWFGLALALAGVYVALLIRRLRGRA